MESNPTEITKTAITVSAIEKPFFDYKKKKNFFIENILDLKILRAGTLSSIFNYISIRINAKIILSGIFL